MAATVTREQALCAAQEAMNKLLQAAGVTCGPDGKPVITKTPTGSDKQSMLFKSATDALTAADIVNTTDELVAAAAAAVKNYSEFPGANKGTIETFNTALERARAKLAELKAKGPDLAALLSTAEAAIAAVGDPPMDAQVGAATAAVQAFGDAGGNPVEKDRLEGLIASILDKVSKAAEAERIRKEQEVVANFTIFNHESGKYSVPKNIEIALKALQNSKSHSELAANEKAARSEIIKYATTNKSEADKLFPVLESIFATKTTEIYDAEINAALKKSTGVLKGLNDRYDVIKKAGPTVTTLSELLTLEPDLKRIKQEEEGKIKTVISGYESDPGIQAQKIIYDEEIRKANEALENIKLYKEEKAKEDKAAAKEAANANAAAKAQAATKLQALSRGKSVRGRKKELPPLPETEDEIKDAIRLLPTIKKDSGEIAFRQYKLDLSQRIDNIVLDEDTKRTLKGQVDAYQGGGARHTRRNKKKAKRTTRRS